MKVADRVAVAEAASSGLRPSRERLTLRELRQRRSLSIKQLEELTGIARGTLSGIETGTRTPTILQLQRLSEFYGVAADSWRFVTLAVTEVSS